MSRVLIELVSGRLFDVAFQDNQQFLQLLSSLRWRVGVFDAMSHVGMNQVFRQRLDGFARGYELHEDFRTVAVLVQHPLNGVHLADNAAHPNFLRVTLAAGMAVRFHLHRIGGRPGNFNPCRR